MHTSLSTLVGAGLAVVGPAEVTPCALLNQATKAQTKRVLRHNREERMKGIRKVGYNVLVVEGCVFSLALLWGGAVLNFGVSVWVGPLRIPSNRTLLH